MLLQVYPDIHLRVEDLIAEDDKVAQDDGHRHPPG